MIKWLYALCYNESHFVGNFLTAYADVDKIIIYDNMSTDNSVALLKTDPRVEIRPYDSHCEIRDDIYLDIKNNCWKEARGQADWVIIVDFDEIFTRMEFNNYNLVKFNIDLSQPHREGYTIIKPQGFNMISLNAPLYTIDHPWVHSKLGTYHEPEEKFCCFRPDQIEEMNYTVGCHTADPIGNVKIWHTPDYKLLHYKAWNRDLYMKKAYEYRIRLSNMNREHGWGFQYCGDDEEQYNMFMAGVQLAKPILEYNGDTYKFTR